MKKTSLVVVLAALVCATALPAQIVFGEPKSAPETKEKPQEEKAAPALDSAVEAWIQVLVKRLGNQNTKINSSATRALVTLGKDAVPTLKKIADSGDSAQAKAAKEALAQIERGNRRRGGNRRSTGEFLKSLGLDEKTIKKAEALRSSSQEEVRDLFQQMQDGEMSREEMREAMGEMRRKQQEKLKEVLGEENFKKYQKEMGGRRGFGGRRRGGGRG